jgi:tetratricopeptide (TPR) repeat protein
VLRHDDRSWAAHHNYGCAILDRNPDEAILEFKKSIEINPRGAPSLDCMGRAYELKGNFEEAARWFEKSLQLDPEDGLVHKDYGSLLMKMGRHGEAMYHFCFIANSSATDKRWDRLVALAWVLSTSPQKSMRHGQLALDLARRADRLTQSGNPEVLQVLASALAEDGQFDAAVETARRAIALAARNKSLEADIQNQLNSYLKKEPFRDPKGRVNLMPGVSFE